MFRLCFFFLLPAVLWGEQTLKGSWGYRGEGSFLYRLGEGDVEGEFRFVFPSEEKRRLETFYFRAEGFKIGNLSPKGLWRYSGLQSPSPLEDLKESTGFGIGRGQTWALNSFGFSLELLDDRGGVFSQLKKAYTWAGFWGSLPLKAYRNLRFGWAVVVPHKRFSDLRDQPFFGVSAPIPRNLVFYGNGEFRQDFSKVNFQIQGCVSLGENRVPGISVQPSMTFYGSLWDLTVQYWYNTPYWINSRLKRPSWESYGRARLSFSPLPILQGWGQWERRRSSALRPWEDRWSLQGGGEILAVYYDFKSVKTGETLLIEGALRRRFRAWQLSARGGGTWEKGSIRSWNIQGEIKKELPWGGASLKASLQARKGSLLSAPQGEAWFIARAWTFKGLVRYDLEHLNFRGYDPKKLTVRFSGGWKKP